MKPAAFDYLAPRSIEEALDQLARHGSDARVLAGGQSLVRLMNTRLAAPTVLVDINRIPGLDHIDADNGTVRIGATARQRDSELSELVRDRVPLLAEAGALVAHASVRRRGTVVGSVAFADPSAELPAALLAPGVGTGELEPVAQEVHEQRPRLDQHVVGGVVHGDRDPDLVRHRRPPCGRGPARR